MSWVRNATKKKIMRCRTRGQLVGGSHDHYVLVQASQQKRNRVPFLQVGIRAVEIEEWAAVVWMSLL